MPTLRLAIDARGAEVGARKWRQTIRGVKLDAKKADVSVSKFDKTVERTGRTANTSRVSVAKLFGGIVAVRALISATKTFANYEETMQEVLAVTKAAPSEFNRLNETVRELGATTRFSASQAGDALLFLTRAGFSVSQSIEALPSTLDLAVAGTLELADAADIVSSFLAQFNLDADQTTRIADSLFTVSVNTKTSVIQLSEALKFAGPAAHAAGLSFEQTAAAAGVLAKSGILASLAGTNLRGIMAGLLRPSDEGRAALVRMGLTIDDLDPRFHSLAEIFTVLKQRGFDLKDAVDLFGRRNSSAALTLAENVKLMKLFERNMLDSAGAAKEAAKTMDDSLVGSVRALISVIQEVVIIFGEGALGNAIRITIDVITDLLRVMVGMDEAVRGNLTVIKLLAGTIQSLIITMVAYRAVLLVSIALNKAYAVSLGVAALAARVYRISMHSAALATTKFNAVVITLRLSIKALTLAMAANPVGILLVALSAGIALIIKFRKESFVLFDRVVSIQSLVVAAVEVISRMLRDLFFGTIELVSEITNIMMSAFDFVLVWLKGTWLGSILQIIKNIATNIDSVWSFIKIGAAEVLTFLLTIITTIDDRIDMVVRRLKIAFEAQIGILRSIKNGDLLGALSSAGRLADAINPAGVAQEVLADFRREFAANKIKVDEFLEDPRGVYENITDDIIHQLDRFSPRLAKALDDFIGGDFLLEILDRAAELQEQYSRAGNVGLRIFHRWFEEAKLLSKAVSVDLDDGFEKVNENLEEARERMRAILDLGMQMSDLRFERTLIGLEDREAEILRTVRNARLDLQNAGVPSFIQNNMLSQLEAELRLNDELERREEERIDRINRIKDAADQMGDAFARSLEDSLLGVNSLNEAVIELGREIARLVLRQAVTGPIATAISGGLQGNSYFGSLFGSANGNVFNNGSIIPFARGGIVDRPHLFPMSGGNTGLMGESGPEAVLPLKRGSGNNLGVIASGLGGVTYNINMKVVTPDVNGFKQNRRQIMQSIENYGPRVKRGQV